MSSVQVETENTKTVLYGGKKRAKIPKHQNKTNKTETKVNIAVTEPERIVSQTEIQKSDLTRFFRSICEKKLKGMIVYYSQLLEQKLQVSREKTIGIWNELAAKSGLEVEMPFEEESSESKICQHYMPKAKRNCTTAVSNKSKTGRFCAQHLKYENKDSDEKEPEKKQCEYEMKNGNKCGKKVSDKDENCKLCSQHLRAAISKEKSKSEKKEKIAKTQSEKESLKSSEIVLRPRKHSTLENVYIDATTNLVIDNESKKIYGRLESNQILSLRKEDEEWLQKHHYEYDMEMWATKHQNDKSQEPNDEDSEDEDDAE